MSNYTANSTTTTWAYPIQFNSFSYPAVVPDQTTKVGTGILAGDASGSVSEMTYTLLRVDRGGSIFIPSYNANVKIIAFGY